MEACIVVPCYNEEKRMPVADFTSYMKAHPRVRTVDAARHHRPPNAQHRPMPPHTDSRDKRCARGLIA